MPVPDTETVCLVAPVGAMFSVAVLLPADSGRNCTEIMQLACGASSAGQLFACRNSVKFAPVNEMLVELNGSPTLVLVFFTVTCLTAEAVPRVTLPNDVKVAGVLLKVGVPVEPERVTLEVARPAPGVNTSEALFVPAVVGVKVTLMVHLVPTASEVPQLFDCVKLAAPVPVKLKPLIGKAAVPVLFSVTLLVAELPVAMVPKARLIVGSV